MDVSKISPEDEMLTMQRRVAELESRIARAVAQLDVADQYATDDRGFSKMPTVWELQNSLIRDALNGS